METSLKTGFAQVFSCCPKNLSCPNFGGAAAPLAPPARTPMLVLVLVLKLKALYCRLKSNFIVSERVLRILCKWVSVGYIFV